MNEFFKEILNTHPGSTLNTYGSHFELFLKKDSEKGGFKITGTKDQVKNSVNLIINLEENGYDKFLY